MKTLAEMTPPELVQELKDAWNCIGRDRDPKMYKAIAALAAERAGGVEVTAPKVSEDVLYLGWLALAVNGWKVLSVVKDGNGEHVSVMQGCSLAIRRLDLPALDDDELASDPGMDRLLRQIAADPVVRAIVEGALAEAAKRTDPPKVTVLRPWRLPSGALVCHACSVSTGGDQDCCPNPQCRQRGTPWGRPRDLPGGEEVGG